MKVCRAESRISRNPSTNYLSAVTLAQEQSPSTRGLKNLEPDDIAPLTLRVYVLTSSEWR